MTCYHSLLTAGTAAWGRTVEWSGEGGKDKALSPGRAQDLSQALAGARVSVSDVGIIIYGIFSL